MAPPLFFDMCEADFNRRIKVADWEQIAQQRLANLRAEGEFKLNPIHEKSRKLAKNAWGSAWMRQLAYCEQEGFALAAGRSLLRHACVLDLRVAEGTVDALISGEEIYEVHLKLDFPSEEKLATLSEQCSAHIDSLLALLEGNIDASVMQQLCDPEEGLLPLPHEWHMDCNCPDWNEPCPHIAAAIYATGCLIDKNPSLLFTLRGLNPTLLCTPPQSENVDFNASNLAETFGIDVDLLL